MENAQEKEFRQTVLSLSEKLKKKDTNNIVYLYSLPKEYEDKEPLTVLELMHNRDLFSAAKPDNLAKLMKEINQEALMKNVEKYVKKTRKTGGKCRVTQGTEPDPSLMLSLQAKLEVTRIQSVITANVLKQLSQELVKNTHLMRVREIVKEANEVSDRLQTLVNHAAAQVIYQCAVNQPSLRDVRPEGPQPIPCNQRSDGDSDIYEDTSSPTNTPCDYEEMCMTSMPREHQQQADVSAAARPGAQMVTGVSRRPGTKPEKPAVLPKPTKTGTTCGSRTAPPSAPQQPVIGIGDLQKRKATLKKSTTTKSPTQLPHHDCRSSTNSDVESDFTGGSWTEGEGTGEGTGDSGFGDVRSFLKDKMGEKNEGRRSNSGTYYKKLGNPDVVDGYMTVTRGELELEDDLYECPPDLLNGGVVEYVNFTKTLK